eukprot:m.722998 g.722998  ORF g.722998 m.722998 type:complete len:467 (+) comp23019_c3_seq66:215-1615(+)
MFLHGIDVKEVLSELREELREANEFWKSFGFDSENGGFFCSLGHNGEQLEKAKFIWYQGRGLWVYSRLYRLHGKDPTDLQVASKTFEFIKDKWELPSSSDTKNEAHQWCVECGPRGAVDVVRPPENAVGTSGYGGAFIAEGMIEYYRATGNEDARNLAIAGFEEFIRLIHDETHGSDNHIPQPFPGSQCLGHAMIVISLGRQLLEDPTMLSPSDHAWVDGQVKRMCHRIERRFYDREYDLLTEVLHPDRVLSDEADTRRADGPNGAFVYLGHGIETSWMLLAEAIRAGDRRLAAFAEKCFTRHVDVAWDPIYGGVFRGLDVEQHQFLLDGDCKVKWAQDEVLVGAALMLEQHSTNTATSSHQPAPSEDADAHAEVARWAASKFVSIRKFMHEKYVKPLRDRGLPYVLVGGNRKVEFQEHYVNKSYQKAASRKENYHHPRALMLVIESLERMLQHHDTTTAAAATMR